jgi:hypothetical protein
MEEGCFPAGLYDNQAAWLDLSYCSLVVYGTVLHSAESAAFSDRCPAEQTERVQVLRENHHGESLCQTCLLW